LLPSIGQRLRQFDDAPHDVGVAIDLAVLLHQHIAGLQSDDARMLREGDQLVGLERAANSPVARIAALAEHGHL
ncbi:hypothetical protein C9R18_25390, partial [Salmonella enterica subsp. enterica serovar Enteritidis]|nr:hypothetical protein [Salmonella enterica subsp. enterica serovar Enteritidis]